MGIESTVARYVPGGGAAWRDPWPAYAALREHDPVHHVVPAGRPEDDYYVLSRHGDVLAAAVDTETFSSARGLTVEYDELERIGLADNPPFVMTDPPVHTAFRRLVARGFTPRQVAELEPAVRSFVVERLDRLCAAGGGDIVTELFKPLPSMVVAHYLGVPEQDRPRFDEWTNAIVAANATDGAGGAATGAAGATVELMAYFSALIERRRAEQAAGVRAEDTVSHLVAAAGGHDEEAQTDIMGILAFVFTMVTGGNDTTTGLLGGTMELLATHPDQCEDLAESPRLVADAVEELLRLTSPVQGLARTTTRDIELHGTRIPAGRRVLLLYGAANRDWRRYGADAEHLDIRRRPTQILTFSQGHHHCLGAAAARLQARVALEELVTRIPRFTVDPDRIEWAPGAYVRRPASVPLAIR
ncbi:cytochrome P450 [Nocardioides bizhenqiangii]|uniref:Cytochrome P450 n=1 Tax=Nocardioides bizhenqiangii TaxID=3095076 RepID=A0ABZ0ZRL4_9ACTN|nr:MULTISPECIES: cytochrome P450 [unclassified Nocardioides]MDZ5619473.1 cytochrome P450 [Nocardioides sp. HM23]WQQ26509.1 cytochrome P450 [Nocardioides sp. HM61]